jgi:DNA-binding CsgD family transcriptional regulator
LALGQELAAPPAIYMNLRALGFLELSVGDYAATHRCLSTAANALAATGVREPGTVRFIPDEVEALTALGELDQADGLLRSLRASAFARPWARAAGGRCAGLLLAARGDVDRANAALEQSLVHHEGLPMPFELGRTLLVQGQIRRRAKQKRAARESLKGALHIFERLGAPLWAERARAELRRIGLRPPASLDLTPTEERVADLVGSGHTNREVAHALFMSVHTVEANLGRIYRKLGVRSRTELAARRPSQTLTSL